MNVVNKEYVQLEERLQLLQDKWGEALGSEPLLASDALASISTYPVIPQLKIALDNKLYFSFIEELMELLKEHQPEIKDDLNTLRASLTEQECANWMKEAIAVNTYYFVHIAEKTHIPQWIPFFVAEHALRPFLQKISSQLKQMLQHENIPGSCPSCGEPPRVGTINEKGKKEISCPRCLYSWEMKKIKCAHCGSEEPGKIEILKLEKDERAEIYICHDCKGYTKVIDGRKMIKKEPLSLLDIKTIHLDYIAQEKGYGIPEVKGTH